MLLQPLNVLGFVAIGWLLCRWSNQPNVVAVIAFSATPTRSVVRQPQQHNNDWRLTSPRRTICWARQQQDSDDDNDDDDKVVRDVEVIPSSSSSSKQQPTKQQQQRSQHPLWLVDDEEDICLAVGTFLREAGYPVTTFADGDQVWNELCRIRDNNNNNNSQQSPLPHILVSDVRMPILDGIQLLSRIRSDARLQALPVVLLTAKGQTQDRIAGYQAGADAYVPKPFDAQELLSVVDNLIEKTQTLLPPPPAHVSVDALRRDLQELKQLLLEQGGGGAGVQGFVRKSLSSSTTSATNSNGAETTAAPVVFLPPDEQDVLELLCQGKTNKEIAAHMYLSQRRIEQLLTHMFRKAGVKNRTELVRWAIGTGHVRM